VSTSPPPGEPGQDSGQSEQCGLSVASGDPELLYSHFPPADPARTVAPVPADRPRRWRVPTVPALAALIVVVLMSGVVVAVDHSTSAEAEAVAAAAVVGAGPENPDFGELPVPPTTLGTALPLAAPAPRTKPSPPPANERAKSPIVKIGEIRIPKIGLVHPVFEGITLTVVDRGPGHWPGSAVPGQLGNAVFAGHRVTHSHPFRNVDKLVAGDEIIFVMPNGTFTYRMTKQQIVNPTDTWIVNPTEGPTLTLFACHPPGSAAKRIVIRGEYVGKS
jgi:sortase A